MLWSAFELKRGDLWDTSGDEDFRHGRQGAHFAVMGFDEERPPRDAGADAGGDFREKKQATLRQQQQQQRFWSESEDESEGKGEGESEGEGEGEEVQQKEEEDEEEEEDEQLSDGGLLPVPRPASSSSAGGGAQRPSNDRNERAAGGVRSSRAKKQDKKVAHLDMLLSDSSVASSDPPEHQAQTQEQGQDQYEQEDLVAKYSQYGSAVKHRPQDLSRSRDTLASGSLSLIDDVSSDSGGSDGKRSDDDRSEGSEGSEESEESSQLISDRTFQLRVAGRTKPKANAKATEARGGSGGGSGGGGGGDGIPAHRRRYERDHEHQNEHQSLAELSLAHSSPYVGRTAHAQRRYDQPCHCCFVAVVAVVSVVSVVDVVAVVAVVVVAAVVAVVAAAVVADAADPSGCRYTHEERREDAKRETAYSSPLRPFEDQRLSDGHVGSLRARIGIPVEATSPPGQVRNDALRLS